MGSDGAVIQLVTRCASEEEFIERFARFTTETDVVVPALPHVSVGAIGHFIIRLKDRSVMMKGRCEVTEIRPVAVAAGDGQPQSARALMRLHLREMDAHSAGIHLRLMERHAASAKPPAPPAAPEPPPPPPRRTSIRSLSLVRPLRIVTPPEGHPRSDGPVASAAPAPAPPASTVQVVTVRGPSAARGAPEPVRVGVPAAHGSAATIMAVAPAPAEAESAEIAPAPRPETRVPGASFTLPANPLSDLDAADLAGFIELTLLETDGAGGAAPIAPATPAAARNETRAERAQRIARRVAPYAACVFVGLWLGIALRPSPKVAVMVGAPNLVDATGASSAAATAAADRIGIPRPRDCVARVTTTPAGAQVFWGDIALGPSPIAHAAIPCGAGTLTFRRERYAELTRTIAAERGQSAIVDERMSRPPAKVVVTSSPPHALIKVNRSRFGPAPRKINTQRFEHIRIEASLPGYRPWKKTLYLKEADTKVDVELAPIAKPSARRAPAPAAPPARLAPPPAVRSAVAAPVRPH